MPTEPATVQIHRFGDSLAIYAGKGETVYLTPETARALFSGLGKICRSLENEPFAESAGLTMAVEGFADTGAAIKATKTEKARAVARAEKAAARAAARLEKTKE